MKPFPSTTRLAPVAALTLVLSPALTASRVQTQVSEPASGATWQHCAALADDRQARLRFHTQLFSGYGDSLLDYNRQRTVLSIGLSLVDW